MFLLKYLMTYSLLAIINIVLKGDSSIFGSQYGFERTFIFCAVDIKKIFLTSLSTRLIKLFMLLSLVNLYVFTWYLCDSKFFNQDSGSKPFAFKGYIVACFINWGNRKVMLDIFLRPRLQRCYLKLVYILDVGIYSCIC